MDKNTAKTFIQRAWNPEFVVMVIGMDENTFLFKFKALEDDKRIWNGGSDHEKSFSLIEVERLSFVKIWK